MHALFNMPAVMELDINIPTRTWQIGATLPMLYIVS
jgi:hypothetical protein